MTTALLRHIHEQDQQALAERHNGTGTRKYTSQWAIESLKTRLPPEHVRLAHKLVEAQATAEGVRISNGERVDCGNGAEVGLHARLDAQREIAGYEQAALTRGSPQALLCARGIAEIDTFEQLRRRVGLPRGSNRTLTALVQVTLIVLAAYDEDRIAELLRWSKYPLDGLLHSQHDFAKT